jgi:hypothetical protein
MKEKNMGNADRKPRLTIRIMMAVCSKTLAEAMTIGTRERFKWHPLRGAEAYYRPGVSASAFSTPKYN